MRVHICTRGWRPRQPTPARPAREGVSPDVALQAVTEWWSTTPEIGHRINRLAPVLGLEGALYALEREGLVESGKSHSSRHRHWRLTPRGAERRDLEANHGPTTGVNHGQ